jgi:hypothetical protein
MAFVKDPGRCDPALCNTPEYEFIKCEGDCDGEPASNSTYSVGSCFDGTGLVVPGSTVIKQLIKGTMASPWVKVWFETNCCEGGDVPCKTPDNPTGCVNCNDDPNCIPTDQTLITTGNISQPGGLDNNQCLDPFERTILCCQAAIKSFQYSWGAINAGNTCKITIHDEAGGSFNAWFKRLARNPTAESLNTPQGVYKMKVQWGWIVQSGDGNACPAMINPAVEGSCNIENPDKTILICSPCLWFLPVNITCQFQNGRFIYELEGVDLLQQAVQTPIRQVFGGTDIAGNPTQNGEAGIKTYFLDAVVRLSQISQPPFNVRFLQLPEVIDPANPIATDTPQPLEFYVQPNQATVATVATAGRLVKVDAMTPEGPIYKPCFSDKPSHPCGLEAVTTDNLKTRGPIGVWDTHGRNPLAAIQSWLGHGVLADTLIGERIGKGITFNYDSSGSCESSAKQRDEDQVAEGSLILWANANPNCIAENQTYGGRLKALYIVNGGKCSPVFSFTPNIKWNFTAAMGAGGNTGPEFGQQHNARENIRFNPCAVFGEAPRYQGSTPNNLRDRSFGGSAERMHIISMAEHLRANYLHNSIEAELRVQGDPSPWLCSPIYGYGRTVAILFINPFFLRMPESSPFDCGQWSNELIETNREGDDYKTSCNEILSNRNWFIKGVDHQIKEGSYITILKIILFNPGSDMAGRADAAGGGDQQVMRLGGDPVGGGPNHEFLVCNQGTWTCVDKIVSGGIENMVPGTNTFCDKVCDKDLYVV